jgi:hypothetical protein
MKRLFLVAMMCIALVSLLAAPAVMAAPSGKAIPASNVLSNVYLYPKEYADAPEWTTLYEANAWGKYNYKLVDTTISGPFNGHGLAPNTDYTLISYNDPWATPFVIIGSGVSDELGDVHIKGTADLGFDEPSPVYDWSGDGDGYKIWLVLTEDITGFQFNAWNPGAYLFENNRIGATAP